VAALAGGTYLMRWGGLVLRRRVHLPAPAGRMIDLGATALLVAVVATGALIQDGCFAGWARLAGVVAGTAAAWRRLPLVGVVLVAAGVTAGLRMAGVG
jgi:branched-subunit amino acid transport protein